jgi:RNA polymerase sigma-70 factor (TIGR02943 family)
VWFTRETPPYDTAAAPISSEKPHQVVLLGVTYRNDLTEVFRFDDQHVPCAGRAQRREQTQILWQEIHLSSDSPSCARNQYQVELEQPLMSNDVVTEPEQWVDRHGDGLYRYALLRLRSPDLAADIVQETFADALRARNSFAGRSSEWAWLVGILRHKIIDHIRKVGRQPKSGRGERSKSESELAFDRRGEWRVGPAEWRSDPSLQLETVEFWDVIAGCLSRLPQSLADAFTLRELDGLEANEVQSILDISPANFWKRLHRARFLLRRCLESRWYGERPKKSTTS